MELSLSLRVSCTGSRANIRRRFRILALVALAQLVLWSGPVSATTSVPDTDSDFCGCSCAGAERNYTEEAATTVEEANTKAEEIEQELTVEKSTVSSTTRTKISVMDERPSAQYIGVIGIVFVSLVAGSILLLDIGTQRMNLKKGPSKKGKKDRVISQPDEVAGGSNDKEDVGNNGKQRGKDSNFLDIAEQEKMPNFSSSQDGDRYLSVPYSITPLLSSRPPLSTKPGRWDGYLSDQLKNDDVISVGSDTIRIRALRPPYSSEA